MNKEAALQLYAFQKEKMAALPELIKKIPITFKGRGFEAFKEAREVEPDGPLFIGSALTKGRAWNVGHWCDVLPYKPIPDGKVYEIQ